MIPLGVPRALIPHGSRTDLLANAGLDTAGIVRAVRNALNSHPSAEQQQP